MAPEVSFQFPRSFSLANTKFYDGMKFMDSTEGISYSFHFDVETYKVSVYTHIIEPYETHVVERGRYVVDYSQLTLIPLERVACKMGEIPSDFPCSMTRYYTKVYFIHRDSIQENASRQYEFVNRIINLSSRNGKIAFKDKFVNPWGFFEQI